MTLQGLRLTTTTAPFINYFVRSEDDKRNEVTLIDLETLKTVYMVKSRLERSLQKGVFEEVKGK